MDMQAAIAAVLKRQDLTGEQMQAVMRAIMTGQASAAQIGGFLVGLRMKGETIEEITAAARVMRELALPVAVDSEHLVDTCGTGGDGARTFNISTACAFVAAAAGAKVAKHGNRSISSSTGSADVLEAAGVNLDLSADQVARCIQTVGVGFMFAPKHHGAMKHAIGPRREMGVRTIFNVLGPLTNPAGAPNQVIGVFSRDLLPTMAGVLKNLGSRHVLVVHARDGMDEISIGAPTDIAELKNGEISLYNINPQDFGVTLQDLGAITVNDAQESLALIRQALANQAGPALDIVVLNAAAAIYAAGLADSMAQGVQVARQTIADGKATAKFNEFVAFTRNG